MVGFDANFVMIALRPAIPASVDDAEERVQKLLADLQRRNERIVIPTPALTEFLVHAEAAGPKYLEEIQKSSRFKIAPYGIKAAVDVALAIGAAVTRKDKRDGTRDTWAKVNFDRQIAAIAKAEGCHTIYTDDPGLKNFAQKIGLKAVTLAQLDLPPSSVPPPLIEQMMSYEQKQKTSSTTPHPAGLQADGAGSTGNKAGTAQEETKKPKPAKEGGLGESGS
jgi:predicted nucleic acid-binding protein